MILIDDDATFLSILQKGMSYQGVEADIACNPMEAKECFARKTYEYAVVDLNIDGESGLKLLQELLAMQPDCKILMLTGYASIATAVEAIRLGALDYLCKPATVEQILNALKYETEHKQITQESEKVGVAESEFESLSVKRLEWEHIQKVLLENKGNVSATAKALNMHRRTLQRKLQKRPVEK